MRFGPVLLDQADGAILAHSVALPEGRLRKGCILGPPEIAQLRATGRSEVIAARPHFLRSYAYRDRPWR